jgi:hypothetical protein
MFRSVILYCLFGMPSSVKDVCPCYVSMVRRLFVMSGLVVFRRFRVVVGGMREMFRGLLVVSCSFLRHRLFLPRVLSDT